VITGLNESVRLVTRKHSMHLPREYTQSLRKARKARIRGDVAAADRWTRIAERYARMASRYSGVQAPAHDAPAAPFTPYTKDDPYAEERTRVRGKLDELIQRLDREIEEEEARIADMAQNPQAADCPDQDSENLQDPPAERRFG
jgi:hypothetical protein